MLTVVAVLVLALVLAGIYGRRVIVFRRATAASGTGFTLLLAALTGFTLSIGVGLPRFREQVTAFDSHPDLRRLR